MSWVLGVYFLGLLAWVSFTWVYLRKKKTLAGVPIHSVMLYGVYWPFMLLMCLLFAAFDRD